MNFGEFYIAVTTYVTQKIKHSLKICAKRQMEWRESLEAEGYYVKDIYYDYEYTYIHLGCDVEEKEFKGSSGGFMAFVMVAIAADDVNAEYPDIIIMHEKERQK